MVAFRNLFPVLAIVGLLLGSSTANAQQTPLQCVANSGVPPVVRAEGLTELVGDIVLTCTGGNSAAPFLANFQLFLNTNITSRLLASDLTDALLLIDEPTIPRTVGGPTPLCLSPGAADNSDSDIAGADLSPDPAPSCNPAGAQAYQAGSYTAFRASTTSQFNAVVWPGIPILPPGTVNATRTIRITNVRANASVIGAATTLIPNQITAFISVSGSQSLSINNPQQTVAFVQRGLNFAVRSCDNSEAGNPSLAQCVNFNENLFDAASADRSTATPASFSVRFTEGFQTAFKPRISTGQELSQPGTVYNSESGFVRSDWSTAANNSALTGVANSGTRVAARFRDLPSDIRLYVSVAPTGNAGTTAGVNARLITAGPNGEGGTVGLGVGSTLFPVPATTNLSCGGTTPPGPSDSATRNAAEIPVVSGTATAVWEITASDPSNIDVMTFLVAVAYRANPSAATPGVGQARVAGTFAPFYAGANDVTNAAGRWSSGLPVPRFLESTDLANAFRVDACESNLLFPFVTAQAGFDTGIAISNTSADHFANPQNRRQGGRCTLNYFGGVTGGGNAPNPQTTNADVPAGGQLVFVLSSGGNFGIAGTPNFQGYIFARCLFRYAHGFAFITDGPIGQARVAEGYLALVVGPGTLTRGTASEVLAH